MEVIISPEWHSIGLEFQESGIYLKSKINFEIPNPFDSNQLVAVVQMGVTLAIEPKIKEKKYLAGTITKQHLTIE